MITDGQTNFLYLADTLPTKYEEFYTRFKTVLGSAGIEFGLIPQTKDILAVDFMPVQTGKKKFVKFAYQPDYLLDTVKWRKTIPDVDVICRALNLEWINSDIVLDGGNVVKSADKVIICDKVFKENLGVERGSLIDSLKLLFEVDVLITIPTNPYDMIGHADCIVRFYNENTVLINQFQREDEEFGLQIRKVIDQAGLDVVEVPYNPYDNRTLLQANGIYINYLQMEKTIILPSFGLKEDELVVRQFESLFPGRLIATVDSNDVAKEGGVLNCITWNIYSEY